MCVVYTQVSGLTVTVCLVVNCVYVYCIMFLAVFVRVHTVTFCLAPVCGFGIRYPLAFLPSRLLHSMVSIAAHPHLRHPFYSSRTSFTSFIIFIVVNPSSLCRLSSCHLLSHASSCNNHPLTGATMVAIIITLYRAIICAFILMPPLPF